jgi:site-specific DNA recombinase
LTTGLTYGPLAYFLKNRVYLGEVHHGGKWFKGEHEAIIDRETFDRVQGLLKSNSQGRKVKRSESGALLQGKLFDDKGHRMSPSFSSKNGVRYRFYVSSALLRGRKAASGSVGRVGAEAIEQAIMKALRARNLDREVDDSELLDRHLLRAQIGKNEIQLSLRLDEGEAAQSSGRKSVVVDSVVSIPWDPLVHSSDPPQQNGTRPSELDQKLVQALVRAHRWAESLAQGEFASVEELEALPLLQLSLGLIARVIGLPGGRDIVHRERFAAQTDRQKLRRYKSPVRRSFHCPGIL